LAEMVEDNPFNSEASGVKRTKGILSWFWEGREGVRTEVKEMGRTQLSTLSTTVAWGGATSAQGKGHLRSAILEGGIIGTDAAEAEKLGEWAGALTGSRV